MPALCCTLKNMKSVAVEYITESSAEYELLDSGNGEKLERYGAVVLSRPDPQVLWQKQLPESEWKKANAVFEHSGTHGKWRVSEMPESWNITLAGVTCMLKLSPFKHVGLFPEQSVHWMWLSEKIKKEIATGRKISVLNLFGYTGGASIACALAGAEVTHVDSSESSVAWAKMNRDASGLAQDAIRFIVDDARKFVEREIRRGKKYDIVLMDPPTYGRGAKNELWKIETDLSPFLSRITQIFSENPVAILLNGYASGYSHVAYKQVLDGIVSSLGGEVSSGELGIRESNTSRILPCGIFAKWENR